MMDRIGTAGSGDETRVQHSHAVILFLALVEKNFAIPAKCLKYVTPQRVSRTYVVITHVNLPTIRRQTTNLWAPIYVHEWHRYRTNSWMIKLLQGRLHHVSRGEFGIVINRENKWRFNHLRGAVSLHDVTTRQFGPGNFNSRKLLPDDIGSTISRTVVNNEH